MKKILLLSTLLLVLLQSALMAKSTETLLEEGISWQLAEHRKALISDLRYALSFNIPEDKNAPVEASETISFAMKSRDDVILDFRESKEKIHKVTANGRECHWQFVNDHIVIPYRYIKKGENNIHISFTAGNQSLNRRDGYVYTLFVPDRARTVFPCFEQPNLKGKFRLHLDIPKHWKAVANDCPDTPIPTYLFAFAAGDFKYERYTEDGISIGAYHRETDAARIAQLPEIMHQVVFAMKWQERFTGVKYPFPKYDLVVLPGFQFGGMEHVGATFYNDNTLFLPANPTSDEQLRRTELIAHETSHMWFGDAVTMNWFDDVWTKEVFANYFAAEITEPLFPDLNHGLNWLKTYVNAAISQDRTEGRTSIRQPLSNMRYAGLIYNNIIYNKAPVMMRKMVDVMGKEAFRRGIQRYVKKYLYANATWDDLIEILDSETPADLKSFSREWVDEAHWPHFAARTFRDGSDGKTYGFIELTGKQIDSLMLHWPKEENATARQALLMNLNENYLAGNIKPEVWQDFLFRMLQSPWDALTTSSLVNYLYTPMSDMTRLCAAKGTCNEAMETALWRLQGGGDNALRTQLLRLLASRATAKSVVDSLFCMWQRNDSPLLSVRDYMTLAYELSVRMPERADSIVAVQRSRITNPDRLAQFDFISRAVSPSQEKRDALFASLSKAENRRIEPWTLDVLYYLNHPLRQQESLKYIEPALSLLPEIQRTGDIFFPGNWCSNLLAGHRSAEAYGIVERFLASHRDYPQLLINKILYAEYQLHRAQLVKKKCSNGPAI